MDPSKILLISKFTKQMYNGLKMSSKPSVFNTIIDIKYSIKKDEFLSLYLSKLNYSEEMYLYFSIYFYHKTGNSSESLKYVLENLNGYEFYTYEKSGYKVEDCGDCNGFGDEVCFGCNGDGNVDCTDCEGNGNVDCPDCETSGKDEEGEDDCSSCNGNGETECSSCDGSGNDTCNQCNGNGSYSCENCAGNGNYETDTITYSEHIHDIYTTNKFGNITPDVPIRYEKYKNKILKQPFLNEDTYRENLELEDISGNYGFVDELEDLNGDDFVIYTNELSL